MKISVTILLFVCLIIMSCNRNSNANLQDNSITETLIEESVMPALSDEYLSEFDAWKTRRFKSITAPKGWLSVVGLHWLKEGENIIGSAEESDIVFPAGAASRMGSIFLDDGNLKFKSYAESYVSKGDNNYFPKGEISSDENGPATILNHHSFYFHVIKRGERYGVRLKNTLAQARFDLKSIPHFPANSNMIFSGIVSKSTSTDSIVIQDVLGNFKAHPLEAVLSFDHKGKEEKLYAISGGDQYYFVIFSDLSSGEDTYGGGRFLYVKKPEAELNKVIIDFNRAENPPCAFTDFATCPLPPDSNKLKILVNAGEKKVK